MFYRIVTALVLAVVVAGCSPSAATLAPTQLPTPTLSAATVAPTMDATGMAAMTTPAAALRTQYPVTVTDCGGRQTTYDKAPERIATLDPSITEMLLVLGLKDKIVGYTEFFKPDRQWPVTKADMATLHQLGDGSNYPSKESVVAVSPDFVTSVYPWGFMDPLPDRDGWVKLGARAYQSLGECSATPPTDFSLLYQDMRNLGIIFDVQDRAEAEIAKLQARVTAILQKARDAGLKPRVLATHDGETDHPGAFLGTANAVIALTGSAYIFSGLKPDAIPSWEQFAAANPDVIWIIPDAGPTAADVETQLEKDPRLKAVTAIRNKAYVVVPQADATVESPRIVDGLAEFVDGLIAIK